MSNAREEILQRLRQNNHATDRESVHDRMTNHARGSQPHWKGTTVQRFMEKAKDAAGTLTSINADDNLPSAVIDFLQSNSLPRSVVLSSHAMLNAIDWPRDLEHSRGIAKASDQCSVTVAFAGIAETGSVVMLASAETPTSLNFLPDNFIVILRRERIVPYIEDAWDLIRKECRGIPRAVNLVTGPSRTADVEQTIQLGAHGPRRLHIILTG